MEGMAVWMRVRGGRKRHKVSGDGGVGGGGADCARLPNSELSAFTDVTMGAWTGPRWEYLHHRNCPDATFKDSPCPENWFTRAPGACSAHLLSSF